MLKKDRQFCVDLLIQHGHLDVARRIVIEFKEQDEYCQKVWAIIKPPIYKSAKEKT